MPQERKKIFNEKKNIEEYIPHEDILEERKNYFLNKKSNNDEWLRQMPKHESYSVPAFLISNGQKQKRVEVIGKLKSLLKNKFSLSIIADILLYNDYENLDKIVNDRKNLFCKAREINPRFAMSLKRAKGQQNSSLYSEQLKEMEALLDCIEKGEYIKKSQSEYELQDTIAMIVDTPRFNTACRLESEFIDNEIDILLEIISKKEDREKLEELVQTFIEKQNELNKKIEAYKKIESIINSKDKDSETR